MHIIKRVHTYSTLGVSRSVTECSELNSSICHKVNTSHQQCSWIPFPCLHHLYSMEHNLSIEQSRCSPSPWTACRCPDEPSRRPEMGRRPPWHAESCRREGRHFDATTHVPLCMKLTHAYQAFTSSATPRKEASSSIPSIRITVLSTSKQTASASRQISLEISSDVFETSMLAILNSFLILIISSKSQVFSTYTQYLILRGFLWTETFAVVYIKGQSARHTGA